MNPGSDDVHVLLGAYVLGGLSDEDHRTYSEHLRTCGPCQAELGQVSGLPRLLDLAGPEGGPHLADGPAAVPEPLSSEQGVHVSRSGVHRFTPISSRMTRRLRTA